MISGGGKYGHPHPEVIQGIILANALRCHECIILLTNSCGLDSEKLGQLHQIVPKWTQYVKIYHYDDVFFIKQRHIMLHPERCISDVHENTVKWTPKGYINRITIMLPVKAMINKHSRPLKKNIFIEKSTVEITIQGTSSFNAHIICVPLPHNPRSGDKINCCYVIEESIAYEVCLSKVLFLLNKDEKTQSLSRAEKYVLFQYINNEWEKKQLPATLKDIAPQTSPCKIPYYDVIDFLWPVQERPSQATPLRTPQQPLQPVPDCSESPQTPPLRKPHQPLRPVPDISPQSSPSHTPQPHHVKMVASQDMEASPTKGCGCKIGCATRRCGCKKCNSYCGPSCQCGSECTNNLQPAIHLPGEGQLRVMPDKMKKDKVEVGSPSKSCECKTGCVTMRCGYKKKELRCGPGCKCQDIYFNCQNQ